jgi:hypothetical protein
VFKTLLVLRCLRGCRYSLRDLEDVAESLSIPMNELGTPQPLLLDFWKLTLQYVREHPKERACIVSYALVAFIPGLSPETAAQVHELFSDDEAVRPLPSRSAVCAEEEQKPIQQNMAWFVARDLMQ